MVRRDIRTDWTVREGVRAKLRTSTRRLLIEHGYPPDEQPDAIKLVMEHDGTDGARLRPAVERAFAKGPSMTQTETFDEFHEPSLFDVTTAKASDDTDVEEDIEEDEIDHVEILGDLVDIVDDLFTTWLGDGEEKWAAQAYLSLRNQGVVSDTDSLDHTRNGVLLCTVWALSKEFYVRAFDEGSVDDWTYTVPDVVGEFPKLSALSIGRLAEREGVYADMEDGDEDPYDVLKELIREYAPEVAAALREDLSDTWILPYMWAIRSSGVTYPLPADHAAWGQLHQPSGNAIDAYGWITEGMPL